MIKSNLQKQVISGFTLAAFTLSLISPYSAHANGVYRDQLIRVSNQFAQAQQYANLGGHESFADFFDGDLNATDREFVSKHLMGLEKFKLKSVNAEIHLEANDGSVQVKIKPINLETGEFRINGLNFQWNDAESLEQNAQRIIPLAQAKGFTFNTIWNQIVPSAEAAILPWLMIAGGIALIFWGLKKRKKNKEAEQAEEALESRINELKTLVLNRSRENNEECDAELINLRMVYKESDNAQTKLSKLESFYAGQADDCVGSTPYPTIVPSDGYPTHK